VVNMDQHTLPKFCLYYNGIEDPQPGLRVMPMFLKLINLNLNNIYLTTIKKFFQFLICQSLSVLINCYSQFI
jgi:hypothetical protein